MRDKFKKLDMWAAYKFWRKRTKQMLDEAKQNFYNNMLKESKDPKIIWKCIHSLNPSNHIRPHRLDLKGDKSIDIANTFNKFFTSCIENLRSENMSTSTNSSKLYNFVNDKISQNTQFAIPPVKMNELLQDLLNLDINKSTGTNIIGPKILKVSAPFIVSPLTSIFNRIIDSGIYPNILKNAKLSPIFKSGEKCLPTNYRPISVLPVISKVIEKHISRHMYQYLSKYNLLHDAQSGFRSNHSCQTALVNIIDKWIEEMNNGNVNVVILLDLTKAFDVVDHDIMAKKLEIYGFNKKSFSSF
jgi:hypothetical protein